MSGIHANPSANGQRFGRAIVTVDHDLGDCVVTCDAPGYELKRMRLHSLEEISGAYQVQIGLAATDDVAADIARALKFAGQLLKAKRGKR